MECYRVELMVLIHYLLVVDLFKGTSLVSGIPSRTVISAALFPTTAFKVKMPRTSSEGEKKWYNLILVSLNFEIM